MACGRLLCHSWLVVGAYIGCLILLFGYFEGFQSQVVSGHNSLLQEVEDVALAVEVLYFVVPLGVSGLHLVGYVVLNEVSHVYDFLVGYDVGRLVSHDLEVAYKLIGVLLEIELDGVAVGGQLLG